MLKDPITVAASAPTPALVLAMKRTDGYGSERVDTGGNGFNVVINHTKSNGSDRHYVQILQTKDVNNPYTGLVQQRTASASMTINRPSIGFSDTEMVALVKVLTDFVSNADVTPLRLLQFQS